MSSRRAWLIGIGLSLAVGAAGATGAATSVDAASPVAAPAGPQPSLAISVAAVGDVVANLVPPASAPQLGHVRSLLQSADVALANFESTSIELSRTNAFPSAEPTGGWLVTPPATLAVLRDLGVDAVSFANNHGTDWGVEGLRETLRHLDDAGLIHSGAGESLAAASAPRYVQVAAGRVAIVSVTSTFPGAAPAGPAYGEARPRPGVHVLRTTRYVNVDDATFQGLRQIRDSLPAGARIDAQSLAGGTRADEVLRLHGTWYRKSTEPGIHYRADPRDVQRLLERIREARVRADVVLLSFHSHEPGNWSEAPADFMGEIARAAIEAGADAVIGHGPHQLRGIQLHRGKPIFYSLGNFFYQTTSADPVVWAPMETPGYDPNLMTREQSRLLDSDRWYEGLVVIIRYAPRGSTEITLHPLSLGGDRAVPMRGIPVKAEPAHAAEMLRRLQRLSQPFGTAIEVRGGVGYVRIPAE